MTSIDFELERFFKNTVAKRPQRKYEETITTFDRDVFWYDRDELSRQADRAEELGETPRITYEDHRKAIETAVNMMRKDTQHDITMAILTHRFFKDYRARAFAGEGSFRTDYTFLLVKVGMIFNPTTSRVTGNSSMSLASKLTQFEKPTLIQINHITGTVSIINPPGDKFTLNEWALKFNESANESTSYRVAGMKVGV